MAERNLKRVRLNLWFCTVSLVLIDVLHLDGWEELLPDWIRYVNYATYLVFGVTLFFILLMYYEDWKSGVDKPLAVYMKDRGMRCALITTIVCV